MSPREKGEVERERGKNLDEKVCGAISQLGHHLNITIPRARTDDAAGDVKWPSSLGVAE